VRHVNRIAAAFLAAALLAMPAGTVSGASLDNPNVPTGAGDAIFAVGEGGFLEPVAVRIEGTFLRPGSTEGQPSDRLRMEANESDRDQATTLEHQHLFFIAERTNGKLHATLRNLATTPADPELAGTGEALVDAVDIAPDTPAVVTRILGYDAHTFAIYTRKHGVWKSAYTGGGVAL
jgi:hypothetical protein